MDYMGIVRILQTPVLGLKQQGKSNTIPNRYPVR